MYRHMSSGEKETEEDPFEVVPNYCSAPSLLPPGSPPRDLPASAFSETQFSESLSWLCYMGLRNLSLTLAHRHLGQGPCLVCISLTAQCLLGLRYHRWSRNIGFHDCCIPENDKNGVPGPSSRQVLVNKGTG